MTYKKQQAVGSSCRNKINVYRDVSLRLIPCSGCTPEALQGDEHMVLPIKSY